MFAGLQVRHVNPMNTAAHERVDLARRIQVVCDFLAINFQLHRIELEIFTDIHRHEESYL